MIRVDWWRRHYFDLHFVLLNQMLQNGSQNLLFILLQKLPSLSAVTKVDDKGLSTQRKQLLMASAELRERKASISIVDLGSKTDESSARLQI